MAALSRELGLGKLGIMCANDAYRMWQGGNQWAGYEAYLSFFRVIAGLDLDYSKWLHWERLAEISGPRILHTDFCIVSDRPEVLTVDREKRPHNDTGPFCRWRDGTRLYSVHGVRVAAWIIEHPEQLTVAKIDAEANTEVRRVMLDRYGMARYMADAGARVVDDSLDEIGQPLRLLRRELEGDEPIVMVELTNSTPNPDGERRKYLRRVPPTMQTAIEARNWTCHLPANARIDVQT